MMNEQTRKRANWQLFGRNVEIVDEESHSPVRI